MVQILDWMLPASVRAALQRAIDAATAVPATVFGLATKADVELQHRITRRRTAATLKELLEQQREQAARLERLSLELREEMQSFAAAMNDQLFALEKAPPKRRLLDIEYDEFEDDDDDYDEEDLDLVSYDALLDRDDDLTELLDGTDG